MRLVVQGHNYGLQLADLVTTVVALWFQGRREYRPLWEKVKQMFYSVQIGGQTQTSLKVMRDQPGQPGRRMKNEIRRPFGLWLDEVAQHRTSMLKYKLNGTDSQAR